MNLLPIYQCVFILYELTQVKCRRQKVLRQDNHTPMKIQQYFRIFQKKLIKHSLYNHIAVGIK